MITILLWAVIFGALAWLFKAVFPFAPWIKTTGFVLCAILCGYECVLLLFTVVGTPPTNSSWYYPWRR